MANWAKISLLHVFLAFQLHTVSIAIGGLGLDRTNLQSEDDAIKAFLIIAYLLFLVTFVLAALVHFGELDKSFPVAVASVVMALFGFLCVIIGVGVFGANYNNGKNGNGGNTEYVMTTYIVGALCALCGGIIMCLELTGHAK